MSIKLLFLLEVNLGFRDAYLKCEPNKVTQEVTGIELSAIWCARYLRYRRIGLAISLIPKFPIFISILKSLGFELSYNLIRAAHSERAYIKNRKRANDTKSTQFAKATNFGSGYGYENSEEDLRVAMFYKEEFKSGKFSARETPAIN